MTLEIERESLKKDTDPFSAKRRDKVDEELVEKKKEQSRLVDIWNQERERVSEIKSIKETIERANVELRTPSAVVTLRSPPGSGTRPSPSSRSASQG
jgi:low affinity Fe/Cu permease